MARRAASSCALVTHPGASACRPYSPNVTVVPAITLPAILPRWALRYLVRLGINIGALPPYAHRRRARRDHHGTSTGTLGAGRPAEFRLVPPTLRQDLPAVDPDLHADAPVGRERLGQAVIDVGPERMQGHVALAIPLVPRDLRATPAPGAGDSDPLGPSPQATLHRLLHGAAVRDAAFQLLGDVLGHELRLDLGPPDFVDAEHDLATGHRVQLFLQGVDAGAAPAADDAGPRRG